MEAHNGVLSIGVPMPNTYCKVFNEEYQLAETNQVGELCLAGVQLTPGYHKNEELNASAFFIYDDKETDKKFIFDVISIYDYSVDDYYNTFDEFIDDIDRIYQITKKQRVRFPDLNKPRLMIDDRLYSLEKTKSIHKTNNKNNHFLMCF